MDDVEAHVARDPHDRVEIGSVVVQRRPPVVDELCNRVDAALEQPQRAGVGEHQAGDVVAELRAQVGEVEVAVGGDGDRHQAARSGSSAPEDDRGSARRRMTALRA